MGRPNEGIKFNETKERRKFSEKMGIKEVKDTISWAKESERIRNEQAPRLLELAEGVHDGLKMVLQNCALLMQSASCSAGMMKDINHQIIQASREFNALIQSQYKLHKEMGTETVAVSTQKALPPSFGGPVAIEKHLMSEDPQKTSKKIQAQLEEDGD